MCTVLLPPGVNPIVVKNISYHKLDGTATRTNTRRCCCLQIRQELLYWKLDRANLDSACLPLFFTAIIFIYYIYLFILLWRCDPTRVMASLFLRFLDHTQRRTTFGRTPLDEWSARRRDLYLTTNNTHNRQTSMHPVGFEPTISAGERPQTYALDRAATGIIFSYISQLLSNLTDKKGNIRIHTHIHL